MKDSSLSSTGALRGALSWDLLEGMLDPVIAIDAHGEILYANRSCAKVFGYASDELVGQNIRILMPEPYHSEHDHYLTDYRKSGEANILGQTREFPVARKDGHLISCELSVSAVRTETGEVVFCGSFRDVSLRKEAERQRAEAQQRETAMLRAFAEIGESASLLTHEIKSPLTAVGLALRAVAKHLGEEDKVVLDDLSERMQRLQEVISRTLSLAKPIDLEPSTVAIQDLLRTVATYMRQRLEEAGVELELDLPQERLEIYADVPLLDDVLENMISNAIEASEQGGRLRIQAERRGVWILLTFDDDGPGVPDGIRASLFKPFMTTKSMGTGLGLAIVRKIIEAHGGRIEVGTSPLGGARFEIHLPAGGHPGALVSEAPPAAP